MKKSLHQVVNSVLIVFVGILCFFSMSSGSESKSKNSNAINSELNNSHYQTQIGNANPNNIELRDSAQKESINNTISNVNGSLNIAYVNSDTVSMQYLFAQKIQSTLLARRSSAEKQMKGKYNSYEQLVKAYQKEAAILGQREAAEKAQNIGKLEQEIMTLEKDLADQLALEELQLTTNYIKETNNYMQKIGEKLGYDYVLSFRLGGPMLFANSKHDITKTVIESLNKAYNEANK